MVGNDRMRVSWMTDEAVPTTIEYGTSPGKYEFNSSNGYTTSYTYLFYHSSLINHVVVGPLQPNTVYYYRCGSDHSREFSFKTPPSSFPIKFAVAGKMLYICQSLYISSCFKNQFELWVCSTLCFEVRIDYGVHQLIVRARYQSDSKTRSLEFSL